MLNGQKQKKVHIRDADGLKSRMVDAMQLHVQGNLAAARTAYEALLKDYPGQPDILHALGTIGLQSQQWPQAADFFRQALKAQPGQVRFLLPLARALLAQGQSGEAADILAEILTVEPTHIDASDLLYELFLPETKERGIKESPVHRLIAAHPDAIGLHWVAIRLCRALDDRVNRLPHLEAFYRNGVRSEDFYVEYAEMFNRDAQFERGVETCTEGLQRYPDSVRLHRVRGMAYNLMGDNARSVEEWGWVAAHAPQLHIGRAVLGMMKLLHTDFKEGFEEFSALRDIALEKNGARMTLPEWRGEKLENKRLLLWCNEGVGDIVMYSGFIPWLLSQGAQIALSLDIKLVPLFVRSFPAIRVVPCQQDAFANKLAQGLGDGQDFQAPLSQLMQYGLPHYTPSQHPPYVKGDEERAAALREKYRALFPGKKLVGISWHTIHKDDAVQRVVPLERWDALFSLPDVQFISLQYGDHDDEIAHVNARFPGKLYRDAAVNPLMDIDALAAQMLALDHIVSIDNATVHFAGALGVPATMLLCTSSEWRWGMKGEGNRWYASLRLERQDKRLDWEPVLARVRDRLA